MNEMKNMISIMLGKMFIIETMLQKAPITNEPNLSQVPTVSKRNKAPVSEQKTVAMSPYNQSKSSSNYILLDSDDDEYKVQMNESNIHSSCSKGNKVQNQFVMILC
jgi:hypothetical protein